MPKPKGKLMLKRIKAPMDTSGDEQSYIRVYGDGSAIQLEADQKEHEAIVREIFDGVDSYALQGQDSFHRTTLFQGDILIRDKSADWQALKQKYGGEK